MNTPTRPMNTAGAAANGASRPLNTADGPLNTPARLVNATGTAVNTCAATVNAALSGADCREHPARLRPRRTDCGPARAGATSGGVR